MSSYINFYLKVEDKYCPLGIYSRNCPEYQFFKDIVPFEKIAPITIKKLQAVIEDIEFAINNEFCQAILDYREVAQLISTYIYKMEAIINPNDGKVHCSFNQYGADTGRFSIQDPNMQNIPSKNHD